MGDGGGGGGLRISLMDIRSEAMKQATAPTITFGAGQPPEDVPRGPPTAVDIAAAVAAATEAAAVAADSASDPAYAEFAILQITAEGPQDGEGWIIAERYR